MPSSSNVRRTSSSGRPSRSQRTLRSSTRRSDLSDAISSDALDRITRSTPQIRFETDDEYTSSNMISVMMIPNEDSPNTRAQAGRARVYRTAEQSIEHDSHLDREYLTPSRSARSPSRGRRSNTSTVRDTSSQPHFSPYQRSPSASSTANVSSRRSTPMRTGAYDSHYPAAERYSDGSVQSYSTERSHSYGNLPRLSRTDVSNNPAYLTAPATSLRTSPGLSSHRSTPPGTQHRAGERASYHLSRSTSAPNVTTYNPGSLSATTAVLYSQDSHPYTTREPVPSRPSAGGAGHSRTYVARSGGRVAHPSSTSARHTRPAEEIDYNSGTTFDSQDAGSSSSPGGLVRPDYTNSFVHSSQGGIGRLVDTSRLRGRVTRPWN